MIKATSGYERFVHWMLAISCLLLCYTGLGMMFESLNFLGVIMGGLKGLKIVHNFTAIIFTVALILAIKMWWKEAGIFVFPEDWEWIKAAGGYLWHVDHVAEVGKYNPGQKAFFSDGGSFRCADGGHRFFHVVTARLCADGSAALDVSAACIGICRYLCLLLHSLVSGNHRFTGFVTGDDRRVGDQSVAQKAASQVAQGNGARGKADCLQRRKLEKSVTD